MCTCLTVVYSTVYDKPFLLNKSLFDLIVFLRWFLIQCRLYLNTVSYLHLKKMYSVQKRWLVFCLLLCLRYSLPMAQKEDCQKSFIFAHKHQPEGPLKFLFYKSKWHTKSQLKFKIWPSPYQIVFKICVMSP